MILTFGKHEGRSISNPLVSYGYLAWVREQDWCPVVLREAIAQELSRAERVAEKDSIPSRRQFGTGMVAQIKAPRYARRLPSGTRKRYEV